MSTDLHTLSGAYAINALSPEEAEQFRKHLDACAACREEVRELQDAAARMGASESTQPPAGLKSRVLAAADRQPQLPPRVSRPPAESRRRLTPRLLAAAAAVVLAVTAGVAINRMQQTEDVMAAPVARVFEASDAETTTVDTANGGRLTMATSESLGKMAVDTDDLPSLTEERVYQLWAIEDGATASAGLLHDPDQGAAMALPPPGTQLAITIEPAGGSEQPTTEPIVVVAPNAS